MKVCKFGGSSLADAEQVAKIIDIVLADSARRFVVVSAPGKRHSSDVKVTDMLIACANDALAGREFEARLTAVIERYAVIQRGLGLADTVLEEVERNLRGTLSGDRSHSGFFMDSVKAMGEDNSARLVAEAFKARGVRAAYLNPGDAGLLLSEDFGNARVLDETWGKLSRNLRSREGIVVIPGFFGYAKSGRVVTFPRGGSDITGAILAAALKADVYENFTDVDSVYPVDPRLVPEVAQGIEIMTYREMRELSYAGFGVFHDEALIPAIKAGIPINVRNTNAPEAPGTLIVQSRHAPSGSVAGIASDGGFCSIFVDKYMMNREIGFGRRLLHILENEGVSYEHMPSGIDNVSVLVRESAFDQEREKRVVARVRDELAPDAVLVERGYALIMVVGEGLYYTVGMAARATRALASASVNIEMINQGSSEISMMFGVRDEQRARAVQALYREFF